ncbi:MAG: hypothetical protein RLZZ422_2917, partial [Pseudomonadota bacterium]
MGDILMKSLSLLVAASLLMGVGVA